MDEAIVREVNGELVLTSPVDLAIIETVQRHNCERALELHEESVAHFKKRVLELGLDPTKFAIVLLSVDDPLGKALADQLMPGYAWQAIRDRGEEPWARGIVEREGFKTLLQDIAPAEVPTLDHPELVTIMVAFNTAMVREA